MSGHRFGCNTCGATFDNPESHDCKDERIKKLESQVRELERQNEDYEALGMKHIELQNKVRELEEQKLSASASCYKTCSELSDRIGELQEIVKAVANIGIDFGHGAFYLDKTHIQKARDLLEKGA